MFGHANGSQYESEPTGGELDFVLKPHMAPLEAVRIDILVFKDLTLKRDSGNAHRAASFSAFGLGAPTSIDQEFANFLRGTTSLASLDSRGADVRRWRRHPRAVSGGRQLHSQRQEPARGVSTHRRPNQGGAPAPSGGTPVNTPSAAEQALLRRQGVLAFIKDDVQSFRSRLGPEEATKVDFYPDSLCTLERQVGANIPTGSLASMLGARTRHSSAKIP